MRLSFSFSFNGTVIVKKTSVKKAMPAAAPVVFATALFQVANFAGATSQLNRTDASVASVVRAAYAVH